MKEKKSYGFLKAGSLVGVLVIGFVVGMVYISNVQSVVYPQTVKVNASWHLVALTSEGNPGAGAGGILWIGFVNYSGTETPTSNSTATMETWSATIGWQGWNNTDDFRQRVNLSTFYPVIRVRGNATQCNRTTFWQDTDLRVRWTCADLGIGADTVMERVVTQNGTGSYLWVNFYDDNGNAGFNLDKTNTWPDNPIDITSIKFEAFY